MKRVALFVAVAVAAISPAWAQINPFRGNGPGLEPSDLAMMGDAGRSLYTAPTLVVGQTATWRNDRTGSAGVVTFTGPTEFQGMPCRTLTYDITFANVTRSPTYTVDWCRTADGIWKFR